VYLCNEEPGREEEEEKEKETEKGQ